MYRVLAIVLIAYAISYPRIASQAIDTRDFRFGQTRAEQMIHDASLWLSGPIQRIFAALNSRQPQG